MFLQGRHTDANKHVNRLYRRQSLEKYTPSHPSGRPSHTRDMASIHKDVEKRGAWGPGGINGGCSLHRVRKSLKKVRAELPQDPAIPRLGILPKVQSHLCPHVQGSITHNSPRVRQRVSPKAERGLSVHWNIIQPREEGDSDPCTNSGARPHCAECRSR